jgi:protein-disulfide isomerase
MLTAHHKITGVHMKLFNYTCAILLAVYSTHVFATDNTATGLTTDKEKLGYSIGIEVGTNLKAGFAQQGVDISPNAVAQGIEDALIGNKTKLTEQQMQQVMTQFEKQQEKQFQAKANKLIVANRGEILTNANDPSVGNQTGKTVLVEFFDYQCVHCRRMQPTIDKLIKANPNLRVVLKEFPILGENSLLATRAALAAKRQDKYWQLHEALLKAQKPITESEIIELAKTNGLDLEKFKQDMNDASIMEIVQTNYKLASDLDIQGTPAFIIANIDHITNADSNSSNPVTIFIPGASDEKTLQMGINQVSQQAAAKS